MLQRVFVDSNVLASKTLRDWLFLLRIEAEGMYQVHATFDVLIEAVRAWRRMHPKADGAASTTLFDHLKANLDELLSDFDGAIEFEGADQDDSHVHAAAVAAEADVLLTVNGRDFGDPDQLPYEIQSPDEFFCLVDDGAAEIVRAVALTQLKYWSGKSTDRGAPKSLPDALIAAGCPGFAARVQAHVKLLAGPKPVRSARDHLPRASQRGTTR